MVYKKTSRNMFNKNLLCGLKETKILKSDHYLRESLPFPLCPLQLQICPLLCSCLDAQTDTLILQCIIEYITGETSNNNFLKFFPGLTEITTSNLRRLSLSF